MSTTPDLLAAWNLFRSETPEGTMARGAALAVGSAAVLGSILGERGVSVLTAVETVSGYISWVAIVGIIVGLAKVIFGAIAARIEEAEQNAISTERAAQRRAKEILSSQSPTKLLRDLQSDYRSALFYNTLSGHLPLQERATLAFFRAVYSLNLEKVQQECSALKKFKPKNLEEILDEAVLLTGSFSLPQGAKKDAVRVYLEDEKRWVLNS